ncbi:MAG TPA: V-type ATP synthase subunit K [Clostridiales bacterium]|nr:V-type ATP synthase subunit K [Clostridiales bacterium]
MEFLENLGIILTVLAGVLASGMAGIGSAKGVGLVGEAATGVLTEEPSRFSKVLILEALPGTQGIYGLLTWFMILMRSGLLSGNADVTWQRGLAFFFAAMPIGIVGYFSAISQGQVAAAGVGLVAKRPEEQSKAIVLAAMVETYAILALLTSIMTILQI